MEGRWGEKNSLLDDLTKKLNSREDLSFRRRSLDDGGNDSDGVTLGADVVGGGDGGDVDI